MTPGRIFGAFVFPETWSDLARFRIVLAALRAHGVNAILTESGVYQSEIIDAVHDLGLRFYAGIACFSDHANGFLEITERPELWPVLETGERRPHMEWYVGISPTDRRHQKETLGRIRSIAASYPIDGLFLDFVRWPLHWEIELRPGRPRPLDSSFDSSTLGKFQEAIGEPLPPGLDSVSKRAAWIRERRLLDWVDFKCKVVTDFVGEASTALKAARPDAEIGIFFVPNADGPAEPLTGQRIGDLVPLVDWVAPMLYHNILLRPPSWIGKALAEVLLVAGKKTLPVLQADSNRGPAVAGDWGPPMSLADWQATLAEIDAWPDIPGLIVFPGTSLIDNGRGEALRDKVVGWRQPSGG